MSNTTGGMLAIYTDNIKHWKEKARTAEKRISELEADVEYWRSHYLRLNMESEGGADD